MVLALSACGGGGSSPAPLTGWAAIRAAAVPQVALPAEFEDPEPQALAVDGWEDGIFISRDGLHLFAVYVPADLLSFTLAGADQNLAASYFRGPTFGMDLTTNPVGTTNWIHGNIIHASRANTSARFTQWHLAPMARHTWSEGAPVAQGPSGGTWDLFVHTTNEHPTDYKAHIALAHGAALDPAVVGTLLPAPVTTNNTEDNPHIERLDANNLVLFFDSGDRPGATGGLDLWYTTSPDNGTTWATPLPVTSLNTALDEHQPHLWRDFDDTWWLYFTATNTADSKLGIFRCQQTSAGDWNAWGTPVLVLGAGNTAGVGEPTLTTAGDLSFVVVYEDTVNGTPTNRFDADPWFMPRRPSAVTRSVAPIVHQLASAHPVHR
ncbi:MAG: exo-alpha-sialidase [Planctomycetes bacterium]|nr:exo-alpha-sialidase [Planctomycetota bacterium]